MRPVITLLKCQFNTLFTLSLDMYCRKNENLKKKVNSWPSTVKMWKSYLLQVPLAILCDQWKIKGLIWVILLTATGWMYKAVIMLVTCPDNAFLYIALDHTVCLGWPVAAAMLLRTLVHYLSPFLSSDVSVHLGNSQFRPLSVFWSATRVVCFNEHTYWDALQ